MKLKIKSLFILFFLFGSGWPAISGGYPAEKKSPWEYSKAPVRLEELYFNHNADCNSSDALNIRMNGINDVLPPEWKNGQTLYPAAYIKNKRITVKAVFSTAVKDRRYKIKAEAKVTSDGNLGNIPPKEVYFSSHQYTGYFPVSGRTPNEVKSFMQEWKWFCRDLQKEESPEVHIGNTINRVYIILYEPQCPWKRTGQSKPWADVLEYSCCWASGEKKPEAAAIKITQSLYKDIGGIYSHSPHYEAENNIDFELTDFLNNIPNIEEVNCFDMGKALVTFSNVVGSRLLFTYSEPFGDKLNCIHPIGTDPDCCKRFNYHAFASINDNIFDASIKSAPPYGSVTPPDNHWLTNIPWDDYKEIVVKEGPTGCPATFLFGISGESQQRHASEYLKRQLQLVKKKYDFTHWHKETGQVIPGIAVSMKILPPLRHMRKVWARDNYSLETIQKTTYSKIRQKWKLGNHRLGVTMVVGPTLEAAKNYLIYQYANTSAQPPERKARKGIGHICLVMPGKQKENLSNIDFIQHNVLFMMQADGNTRKKLLIMAKKLDELLLKKKPVKYYSNLKEIPKITRFSCKKKRIKWGESASLSLEVKNPENKKLRFRWRMSGGGIEKDCNGNYVYYGGETGKQTITVTVINDAGLHDSKSLEIEVAACIKK